MKCCEQYAAALSAFVDGELSENEKEEVLSHVEHCQNCREYLSELMIVHTMFEEMPELDAPEGFSERVLERVHEEKRERSRHRRAWPRVLAACFALLVVTAAAWKLAPAMGSNGDSAADCNTSGNDTVSAPAASGDTAEDFTYSYSAVQKEGVQADASPFDTYDAEDGADATPPTQAAAMPSSRWMCPRWRNFCTSAAWPCTRKITSTSATSSWPKRHMT